MSKFRILTLVPFLLIGLVACNQNSAKSEKDDSEAFDDKNANYYSLVEKRNPFDKDCDLNFVDEITNGLDDSVWNTLDGYWENGGTTPHNGVRRRNIFYTKDSTGNGYVALKARGNYNTDDPTLNGKPEGACIETKNSLGPGRYEVEMAAMPREGGVTAMWTYKCTTGSEATSQNEIDIEIGGGGQYSNLWCTTWTTKTNKATHAPDVSNICYMNDGIIHKYTFDWYTDYGTSGQARIDWFIDGQLVQSIKGGTISTIDMPIWLGVWLPSWAGNAHWVEDYILVDKVSYTAFDSSQFYDENRAYTTYSPLDPSKSGIQNIDFASITSGLNKLSNPSFELTSEYATDDYYGWKNFGKANDYTGTLTFVNDAKMGNNAAKVASGAGNDGDGYFYQRVSCSYKGFKYHFEIDAKLLNENDDAEIIVWQKDFSTVKSIKMTNIKINSTSYKTYSADIEMLDGAATLDIFLHTASGAAIFDNAKLFRTY